MQVSDEGGEGQVWRKVGGTHVSILCVFPVSAGEEGERPLLAVKLQQHQDGEQSVHSG